MPALFSPRADLVLRTALGVAALLVIGTPTLLMAWVRTPQVTGQHNPIEQPVVFDHRHHVADAGIDCRYCHDSVERSRYAGVPASSLCMNCHGQVWNDSPLLAPVRRSYFENKPILWNRVHRLPGYVYFDHSIHLKKGVGCVTCHGRVDEMAGVYQEAPLTMGWCLDCHRAPESHLRPHDKITSMDWQPAGDALAAGRAIALENDVQHLTHCSTCHR
jgi:hypothetical protein